MVIAMYEDLRKLSYKLKNIEEYQQIYQDRFNSVNSLHLDFEINGNTAFLLYPPETLILLEKIYKTDKAISALCAKLPPAAVQQFAFKCLIDEIILTNKIEGVKSSRRQISDILNDLDSKSTSKKQKQRFEGLVKNYCLLSTHETISLNTCEDIRTLYNTLVLDEVLQDDKNNAPDGKLFRKDMVDVKTVTDKVIHNGVFPEEKIICCLEKALKILHDDTLPKLVSLSLFHYLFEYIHPFYDGNGRLGRYILSYTIKNELEPILAYRLSYTIHERKNEYEEAFKICNDSKNKGDLTPFILMMLSFIEQSTVNLYEGLDKRYTLWKQYLTKLSEMNGLDSLS